LPDGSQDFDRRSSELNWALDRRGVAAATARLPERLFANPLPPPHTTAERGHEREREDSANSYQVEVLRSPVTPTGRVHPSAQGPPRQASGGSSHRRRAWLVRTSGASSHREDRVESVLSIGVQVLRARQAMPPRDTLKPEFPRTHSPDDRCDGHLVLRADAGTRTPNLPLTRLPIHDDHGRYQRLYCLQ
jgi:hypothetical protein